MEDNINNPTTEQVENKESSLLLIGGIIQSPTGMKDGTMKFTFYCQELTPDKMAQLMLFNNKLCFAAFKEEDFHPHQLALIADLENKEIQGKTKSERLRSVLYLNFKQDSKGYKNFDDYYKFQMEHLIEHFKKKLPEQ